MNNELTINTKSISKFKPFLIDDPEQIKKGKNSFILKSGRIGGKTIALLQKMEQNILQYRDRDIIVLRANSTALKDSVFLEFQKKIIADFAVKAPDFFTKFDFRSTPPMVITSPFGNQIRFGGVGLGSKSGSNQSKGKVAEHPLSLIVVEETQEIFMGTGNADLLKNAIATYIRLLDDKIGKIVYAGNTERNRLGKFNQWVEEQKKDPLITVIETSWLDIKHFLNRATIQMIEREYELNPNNAKYLYGGEPIGGVNLVYGGFNEILNTIPADYNPKEPLMTAEMLFAPQNLGQINQVFIGVDGAQTHDKMVFEPYFQFKNAKIVLRSRDILYHDPLKNGVISNSVLIKKYFKPWFIELYRSYSLMNRPIAVVVDGHCTDIISELQYELAPFPNVQIIKFTRKDLLETTKSVNNAFTDKKLYITLENWKEMISNDDVDISVLLLELATMCWDETDATKFNNSIPNDLTDGMRYPISWFMNPYQREDFSERR